MPEVKQREIPIEAASFSGFWRTSLAQLHIYQDRPAPTCAFLLAVAYWIAALCRIFSPELQDPRAAGICLLSDVLFRPNAAEWKRYLLHPLWPLESSYARGFFVSMVLLLQGYTFEYEMGTPHFLGLFLGCHVATAAALLYFRFSICHVSIEAALAAMAVVLHRVNPKIYTDGLDKAIRVEFAVEPRWHMWMIFSVLLLLANDFSTAFTTHVLGLLVGAVCVLRDPEVWESTWSTVRTRSPGLGRVVHTLLFVFCVLFMPLTTTDGFRADFVSGILNLSALDPGWWKSALPGSAPLLHMVSGPPYFICRILLSSALPLLLSPFSMWTRVYSVASVLLVMYTMNLPEWQYPHIGFVTLIYLVWAFWKLPGMQPPGYKWA
mmetsp:Transcript_158425/g.279595  ORF Transcript_158425/g.279595 Transcript_158425/m.279595 type:complete len:378 (+) Transcript_158425:46-1179(+)